VSSPERRSSDAREIHPPPGARCLPIRTASFRHLGAPSLHIGTELERWPERLLWRSPGRTQQDGPWRYASCLGGRVGAALLRDGQ
jgi:hypothetical protein